MYRVMIVDDEPTAVNLIKTIIQTRCQNFEVYCTAYDGKEALEKIEDSVPDILITDVQMPVMNGLELVEKTKKLYPDVISVIVSGYQEFEYAQEAMRFEVSDYILKPILPAELCSMLEKLEERLRLKCYRHRNMLLHKLVNEIPVEQKELLKYFQSDRYYGSIVRLNGLPSRFSERNQKEIFSDINEWMLAYGRDNQETLYLCPQEVLNDDYVKMIKEHIDKEQPDAAYATTVIYRKSVPSEKIGGMIRSLYRTLDSVVVLGKSQTLILNDEHSYKQEEPDRDYDYLHELEYLAQNRKYGCLQKEIEKLILKWGAQERPQIWIEGRLRQICYLLQRYGVGNEDYRECEFLMDEAFYNAENIEQLAANMGDILFKDKKETSLSTQKMSTEEYFFKIKEYMRTHMSEPLNLQSVSKDMGVSQTYLSRMFRKYEDSSFNTYLTELRMEKAKKLLKKEDKILVKDVAEQVGYKDQFYFSRIFYSYTGIRPSEYVEKE